MIKRIILGASMAVAFAGVAQAQQLPAFPGAEGFGRYTTGGRGGEVYHVTTLDDNETKGTLRHALMQEGKRTIVFDVAGTIFLKKPLRIVNGDLTIAGQTAPGGGICIAGNQFSLNADNTIMRYVRVRVGNEQGGSPDGIGGTDFHRMIIDHCSVSWSVDECCSVYGGEDFTVQWCIFSEPLRFGGHQKGGSHGYGAIFGGAAASTKIEDKLQTYFSKVGMTKGKMSITFKSDKTFCVNFKNKKITGTYTISDNDVHLTFKGRTKPCSLTPQLENGSLVIVGDATKLKDFLQNVAGTAGTKELTAVSSLMKNFNGMLIGVRFSK